MSYEFGLHLEQCGIVSQIMPPGTPQRNGVSERHNRTLLDMVRSMMSLTDLPLSFWGYALETTAFTLNRAPSNTTREKPSSSACFRPISSAGTSATGTVLQLKVSSSVGLDTLLLYALSSGVFRRKRS